jgi:hypothetical protein
VSHRVVPDSEARAVELQREGLRRLTGIVDWRRDDEEADDDFVTMPDRLREGLKRSTAFNLILHWVELCSIDALVAEIGEEFNAVDPLRPVLREKLESNRKDLLTLQEWLQLVRIEVELREPLEEELQEMREWLAEMPTP